MSMIFDLIFLLIFVLAVLRGWRQGIVSTLLRLLGWAAAVFIIVGWTEGWAASIYHGAVESRVISAVSGVIPADTVAAMNSGADAVQSVQSMLDSLDGILGMQTVDGETANTIIDLLRQDTGSLAQIITQTILEPVLLRVIRVVLSIAVLIVSLMVFGFFARRSARRKRGRGILGKTNQLLGGALGVGEGLAIGYIYALALSVLAGVLSADWLTPDILEKTFIISRLL